MKLVIHVVVDAVALGIAAWLLRGITLDAHGSGAKIVTLLVTGAIFGLLNWLVKPFLTFLSLPFVLVTLGLFLLVINAAMLKLTSVLSGGLGVGFHVEGFWTAVGGGIVVTVASWVLEALVPEPDRRATGRRR